MSVKQRLRAVDTTTPDEDVQDADSAQMERLSAMPRPYHTKRDVTRLQQECKQLSNAIAGYGVPLNTQVIEIASMAYAALRLLVLSGIVSESDAQGEQFTRMREILSNALVQVEAAADKRKDQQRQPQAVRAPGLLIARH